ncbi:MAG: hypothetical protein ABIB71_09080 [Candidatus Woesearchaeota archaeon]
MAKKKRAKPGVTVHVQLRAPKALRKDILSVAIAMIGMIKKYRAHVAMKKRKELLIKHLGKKFREIKELRKVLNVEELPLSLSQVESMPRFKGKKRAMDLMEEARLKGEREWREEQRMLRKDLSRPVKEIKIKVKTLKSKGPKKMKKPVDKLQADLDALRRKMASI